MPQRLYGDPVKYDSTEVKGHIAVAPQKIRELQIPRFRAELEHSNLQMVQDRLKRGELRRDDIIALREWADQDRAEFQGGMPRDFKRL